MSLLVSPSWLDLACGSGPTQFGSTRSSCGVVRNKRLLGGRGASFDEVKASLIGGLGLEAGLHTMKVELARPIDGLPTWLFDLPLCLPTVGNLIGHACGDSR